MKKKIPFLIRMWSLGGLLALLLGVGAALLPWNGRDVRAASVRIEDRARVLDVARVREAGSKLSQPVYIFTAPTFSGSKSMFVQSVQRTVTDQKMIAIGIGVEQRYLAIVAGTQAGVNGEQITQARQAFSQAYGENAGANGDYTAGTLAALESLQSSGGAIPGSGIFSRFGGVFGALLFLLIPLLLIGVGVFAFRRLFRRGDPTQLPKDIPDQQSYVPDYRQQPGYASNFDNARANPPGYGGMPYDPNYPAQQRGMNPWVAGGLGAVGGGLLGYGLGQAMSGNEQGGHDTAYASGESVPADVQGGNFPDFGAFDSSGADFGGSDFGGGDF